jgi:hypothetical protein
MHGIRISVAKQHGTAIGMSMETAIEKYLEIMCSQLRNCKICNKVFRVGTKKSTKQYCSYTCLHHDRELISNRVIKRRITMTGRQSAITKAAWDSGKLKRANTKPSVCLTCGKIRIVNIKSTAKYCNNACFRSDPNARCLKNGKLGNSGEYFSFKNNKNMFYASSFELKAMKMFDINPDIMKWDRCNFYIPYTFNGEQHKYFPDFILDDDHIVEVKPAKASDWQPTWKFKLQALKDYCNLRRWTYGVWTEFDLFEDPLLTDTNNIYYYVS